MKIALSPMAGLRAEAVGQVNQRFARLALDDAHRAAAHHRKREIAMDILDGGNPRPEFAAEAALRRISVVDFARLVLSKPSAVDARELQRQRLLLMIDRAVTPDEIGQVRAALNQLDSQG